ncbi:MAG: tetratricopeptide repeat protein [Porticoccaceae bacterium]
MTRFIAFCAITLSLFFQPLRSEEVCDWHEQMLVEYYRCLFIDEDRLQAAISSARSHDLEAIELLWNYYLIVVENQQEAEHWLREGSKAGSSSMAFTLGSLLTFPDRTKVEQAEGEALLLPLAERGHLRAQMKLGYFYEEQSDPVASWWFERAAWRGDTDGMSHLAGSLAKSSVCIDRWQAAIWYQVAAKFLSKGSWAQRESSAKAERLLVTSKCSATVDVTRLSNRYVSAIKAFKSTVAE